MQSFIGKKIPCKNDGDLSQTGRIFKIYNVNQTFFLIHRLRPFVVDTQLSLSLFGFLHTLGGARARHLGHEPLSRRALSQFRRRGELEEKYI